jgi:enoyl-CoA hydratase/carnithine racemase
VAFITTDIQGPVALVRLSRPEKRNAMTPEMLLALHAAIVTPPSGARAIVSCGEGQSFSAGFDLAMCKADPSGKTMAALLERLSACLLAMRENALPLVVAAHGVAVAGGCALLAAADVVVADRACKVGYPVVRIGVSPAVNAPFVQLAMGNGPMRERMLDTALVPASRAAGLVHELVETPSEVLPAAMRWAQTLAEKGPAAITATKKLLLEIQGLDGPEGTRRALEASLGLVGGQEERERLGALKL